MSVGKNSGGLLDPNEYDIEYDSVINMTKECQDFIAELKLELELELKSASELKRSLLEQEKILELPQNALLILRRIPSCEYYLIEANGGKDSPVFYYNGDEISKEFDSFIEKQKIIKDAMMFLKASPTHHLELEHRRKVLNLFNLDCDNLGNEMCLEANKTKKYLLVYETIMRVRSSWDEVFDRDCLLDNILDLLRSFVMKEIDLDEALLE